MPAVKSTCSCDGKLRRQMNKLLARTWPEGAPFPPAAPWIAASGITRDSLLDMLRRAKPITYPDGSKGFSIDGVFYDQDSQILNPDHPLVTGG